MPIANRYDPDSIEPRLVDFWRDKKIYSYDVNSSAEVYSIDTPPPTVSGYLHLGHTYSYSHTDFIARFWRMRGREVFYPMGFDDNGLPTERFVEKNLSMLARDMGRTDFIDSCMETSESVERGYKSLWQRLGLSIDWDYSYRTIDENSQGISQWSFLDLLQKGRAYQKKAPAIWCPECRASFAQADLDDMNRNSNFITVKFKLQDGKDLPIATTRPELLAACVGIFVSPKDKRYQNLVGKEVIVPIYNHSVPIISDPAVDPLKGTGVVMCCTFGDTTDISWWRTYNLQIVELISQDGTMLNASGALEGLSIDQARQRIKTMLSDQGYISGIESIEQSVRVHERCDTPIEYLMINQWFINILDRKQEFIDLGEKINWYPDHMKNRYQAWVENLNWDWCLSRQRYYGVPFPIWYCKDCRHIIAADIETLPVDPFHQQPNHNCPQCGCNEFLPDNDLMDTWATSSMSPQIVGGWKQQPDLYNQVFPFSLRPQAHDIIRTWAFYTIIKTYLHFDCLPWRDVAISGWGIAGAGMGKISKSRGGGPLTPSEVVKKYSADALRYWAASTAPGKDAVISQEKIESGHKFAAKLWNVSRFAERFLSKATNFGKNNLQFSSADRWILARLQSVIKQVTVSLEKYDYAAAKSEVENFFWHILADNYLEMCKQRLYAESDPLREGAVYTLHSTLHTILKLLAPFMPFVTEEIFQELFKNMDGPVSIHRSDWPKVDVNFIDSIADRNGSNLILVASAVRRYKSENKLPLNYPITRLQLGIADPAMMKFFADAVTDLKSVTRAEEIELVPSQELEELPIQITDDIFLAVSNYSSGNGINV